MKRFLFSGILVSSLLYAGGLMSVPLARADCLPGSAGCDLQCTVGQACTTDSGNPGTCVASELGNACIPSSSTASNAAAAGTPITPPSVDLPKDTGGLIAGIMSWIASLFAWLVTAAMITLNYAVYYTVIKMGTYVNNLSAIGVTWRILRDIGNILLIFGFLASGIMVMFGTEQYGFGSKMLPKLLLAAIFINFSLFFAEAIVDTGNYFATQFYTQINGGALPTSEAQLLNQGVSGKIMQQLGLTDIYSKVRDNPKALMDNNPLFIGFMSIILFIVVAFVMFSLAFMLIARFVSLIVLIIVAPIGFAGWAIPQMQSVARKWWGTLVEQTMTAPVLLLLLYVALAVITDAQFLSIGGNSPPNWLGFVTGKSADIMGYASILLSFLVAMGLLLIVLTVAKSMSAAGAGWATQAAGKLTFGTTALAGRYTGGLLASKAAKGLRRTWVARVPLAGTGLVKGLEKVGASNFDLRASTPGSAALKTLKVDAGQAQKGGYEGALKEKVETRTKYAAGLEGKDFKDLSAERQLALANQGNEIERLKKEKAGSLKAGNLTPERLKYYDEAIVRAETELDTMHKEAGTEQGNKLKYAQTLGETPVIRILASNREAAKKIKDEAKKSKDDKDLEQLKKLIKKAGGGEDEEKKEEKPAAPAESSPPSASPPPAGGGK